MISGNDNYTTSAGMYTNTEQGAGGAGGNINVTTGALSLSKNTALNARSLSNYRGGDITIEVNTLKLTDGSQLNTASFGSGDAGDITINAKESITLSGSDPSYYQRLAKLTNQGRDFRAEVANYTPATGLLALTQGTGAGGKLTITTRQLRVLDGAQISASTDGQGRAGTLEVTAPGLVELIGSDSGLFAQSTAVGTAGDLTISTGQLQVLNGAAVSVSALSGQAGTLTIEAGSVRLENSGKLTAVTRVGDGGNIGLRVRDLLLMRNNSLISAEALGTANGGNITINTPFIVAVPNENSDISANAYIGKGGNIQITTSGIFGLQFRPQSTPLSDITASSQFGVNGTVQITTPGIDPSRGIADLPTQPVDASRQIAQGCYSKNAIASQQSKFVVTGRGGLPPDPSKVLTPDAVEVDWVTDRQVKGDQVRSEELAQNNSPLLTSQPLLFAEAQGWEINARGEVVLTTSPPNVTSHSPSQLDGCDASNFLR